MQSTKNRTPRNQVARTILTMCTNPDFQLLVQTGDRHDPDFWLAVFQSVYGEDPKDPEEIPEDCAVGSTDPRWDSLLLSKQSFGGFDLAQRFSAAQ